jgi:hypothetical protein
MTLIISMLILWIVSAPLSYLILRRIFVADLGEWMKTDRLIGLCLSVAGGPMTLAAIGFPALLVWLYHSPWANEEAKW